MTDTDRQKLAAILGMLGSEHAGERDNAALAADAFRRKHRMTWAELLAMKPEPQAQWDDPPPEPEPPPTPRDFNIFPVALTVWGVVTACLALAYFS